MRFWAASTFAISALSGLVNALTGDRQCSRGMCVGAIVYDNSTVQYTLTVDQPQVGWMAIGFGRAMIGVPIVLLFQDPTTGGVVVSHRQARSYSQPQVVASPPRVATALDFKTAATSSSTSFTFEMAANTETRQSIVWAYSNNRPSGSGPSANIVEHDDQGEIRLNLANVIADPDGDGTIDDDEIVGDDSSDELGLEPLSDRQRMIVAHGIILAIAFMVILPGGALVARLGRTFIPGKIWFASHWVFQWPVAGTLIAIGFALGIYEVGDSGKNHFSTTHKMWGLIIPILYVVQCTYGGIIHFIKPKNAKRRPPQNYGHAVLGITIIVLASWQVRTGFHNEWPRMGRGEVSDGIGYFWTAWVIIIAVLYFGGLVLLKRQYRQEAEARRERQYGAPLR